VATMMPLAARSRSIAAAKASQVAQSHRIPKGNHGGLRWMEGFVYFL